MQISTLTGCGREGRAEAGLKLAWECCAQYRYRAHFAKYETSFIARGRAVP